MSDGEEVEEVEERPMNFAKKLLLGEYPRLDFGHGACV
jgi:hypothetical protein